MQRWKPIPFNLAELRRLARGSVHRLGTRKARWGALGLAVALAVLTPLPAARAARLATLPLPGSIRLLPSISAPQPVGTQIAWTAYASDSVPLVYRFSIAPTAAGPYTVVRDFSPHNTFVWAPLQEGAYVISVSIKEGFTGTQTISTGVPYSVSSRVSGGHAVVSPMANPLVALYSAPACASGQMMVAFRPLGAQTWTSTNTQPCQAGLSRNFLVAGMLPRTIYEMAHIITNTGVMTAAAPLLFTTGALPRSLVFPTFTTVQPPTAGSDYLENLVFHDLSGPSAGEVNPLATGLGGRVLWYNYQPDLKHEYAFRIDQVGGQLDNKVLLAGGDSSDSGGENVLRIIDLAGDPLQETNMQAINQQLLAQGQTIIYGFSHDALALPNGDIATLGYIRKVITTTAVMGDMLLVLDPNLQVAWTWNPFNHLNPFRGPTLGDTCGSSYRNCPVPGGPSTIDWTHANAIDYTPADGNLLISLRAQDWIIKINYSNGRGDGRVLWRLGAQGDFALVPLNPADPFPWFSHQHDANFVDSATLAVFDNGNTRCAGAHGACHSRGQAYTVNEQTKVVTQTVNADLGSYSAAFGTAQRLSNGDYNFTSGVQVFPPPPFAQDIEVQPSGAKIFVQQVNATEYRAWRLASLYAATNVPCPGCSSPP